ncbi:hypothetical protein MN116_000044, partial [Schistosoma mekongi]
RSFGNNYRIPEQNKHSEKPFLSTNTEWNPVQIIHMLIEIKRCLDNVQSIHASSDDDHHLHHYNHHHHHYDTTTLTTNPNVTSLSPSSTLGGISAAQYGSRTAIFRPSTTTSVNVGNFSQPSSAPSQTATDCLDTLRSYNTLTTEFAGDETSRSAHHYYYHHFYQYHPNDDTQMTNMNSNMLTSEPRTALPVAITTTTVSLSAHSTEAVSTNDATYEDTISKYNKNPLT